MNNRTDSFSWFFPQPVWVKTNQLRTTIPMNDTINIYHWDNFEYVIIQL